MSAERPFVLEPIGFAGEPGGFSRLDVLDEQPDELVEPTGAWAEHLAAVRDASSREGFQSGYDDGFAAGQVAAREANAALREQVASAASALAAAVTQLHENDRRTADELAGQALELAFDLAQIVLDREVELATDPGMEAIRRCLDLVPTRTHVVLRLHPLDVETLGEVSSAFAGATVDVVRDPAVAAGRCPDRRRAGPDRWPGRHGAVTGRRGPGPAAVRNRKERPMSLGLDRSIDELRSAAAPVKTGTLDPGSRPARRSRRPRCRNR